MRTLEEIIKSKRMEFDQSEPSEGHFERFSKKLNANNNQHAARYSWLQVAASALLIISLSVLSYYYFSLNKVENRDFYAVMDDELKETMLYYSEMNLAMEEQIISMNLDDEQAREMIMEDLEAYDKNFKKLKKILFLFQMITGLGML